MARTFLTTVLPQPDGTTRVISHEMDLPENTEGRDMADVFTAARALAQPPLTNQLATALDKLSAKPAVSGADLAEVIALLQAAP